MPSKAKKLFEKSSEDIRRLLEIHSTLGGEGKGRRYQLEVLNKSAIVLITATWEAYCEDVLAEVLEFIVEHAPNSEKLSDEIRRQLAKELKGESHELAVWQIADGGWRGYLRKRLHTMQEGRNRKLNTPKADFIDDLFLKGLGVSKLSRYWYWHSMTSEKVRTKLDKYVELRGAIAHRGSAAKSVKRAAVEDYFELTVKLVKIIDSRMLLFCMRTAGRKPW